MIAPEVSADVSKQKILRRIDAYAAGTALQSISAYLPEVSVMIAVVPAPPRMFA